MSSDLPLSTSDIKQEVQIRKLAKSGQAALPPTTVMANWDERVREMGDKPALHAKILVEVRMWMRRALRWFRMVVSLAVQEGIL